MKKEKVIISIVILGLFIFALAQTKSERYAEEVNGLNREKAEAQGIDWLEQTGKEIIKRPTEKSDSKKISLNRFTKALMIPDWTSDSVGLYDPNEGTFLGYLLQVPNSGSPKNAIPGPDGNIYVSDQIQDAVFVFDTAGTYLYTYADASDDLDNIRGIAFRGDHLFVTSAAIPDRVFEFSGPHTFVRNFILDGSDPFDIFFLEDGRALLSNIEGSSDNVRLYDSSGTFISQVIPGDFPQQIQFDSVPPGDFLNAMWGDDQILDFKLEGTIVKTLSLNDVRGVYRLGNGNILATNSSGVYELDSATGAVVEQENTGSAQYIELYSGQAASVEEGIIQNQNQFRLTILPNPTNNITTIRYNLPKPGPVRMIIYDVTGSIVKTYLNTNSNQQGVLMIDTKTLSAGVYILRFYSRNIRATRKLVLKK